MRLNIWLITATMITLFAMTGTGALKAQIQAATPPAEIRLWSGDAPGALGQKPEDIPTLTPYLPASANAPAAAMLVLPGGGYSFVATDHEGTAYAQWLNQLGIAAFVLKYRLGSHGYHDPVEIEDASRAIRTIRAKAAQWNIDPKRVGVIGSSAGGHLASSLATHFDAGLPASNDPIEQQSSRPDLCVLCYAVITMNESYTNGWTRTNLLGTNPTPDQVTRMSSEQQVTPQTPQCFIWTTYEDGVVPMENSMMFAEALRKNKVPFDLHIYQRGSHGIGLGDDHLPFEHVHPWTHDLAFWLTQHGFMTMPSQ